MAKAKRALISVSDKTGAVEFAQGLAALGIEIISTGGTAKALNDAGVPTTGIESVTGFPECLDGRVKTLHPKIHGGLLAVRDNPAHMAQMQEHGVGMIDIVAVNLYPFVKTVSKPGVTLEDAIENIDIGGPSMTRSAAKNWRFVTVLTDPADYGAVLEELKAGGETSKELRYALASKAFAHTAAYDASIAAFLATRGADGAEAVPDAIKSGESDAFPEKFTPTFEKALPMRYGENPHQKAAFYREPLPAPGSLATFEQLHGKELSYNNIGDLDGALSMLREFDAPAVIAVKHANACGAAVAPTVFEAYEKAWASDPESIFGGIVAANRPIDLPTAQKMNEIFLEIVAAPSFEADALAVLTSKKNIRLLALDTAAARAQEASPRRALVYKKVSGGLLVQESDNSVFDRAALQFVTKKRPSEAEIDDLWFAMAICKHTKSNAIVLAKGCATVGVGPGQTSRIMATNIAIKIAGDRAQGSVAASDAFFPFPDCVEALAAAGVTAIVQPGGSKNDAASIEACDRLGIAMVCTGLRHFYH